jgi:hypothetical protein
VALEALRNSIRMARDNMDNDAERKVIIDLLASNFKQNDELV